MTTPDMADIDSAGITPTTGDEEEKVAAGKKKPKKKKGTAASSTIGPASNLRSRIKDF